nr:unnamed protein product [Naegleria fowleri]
MDHLEFAIRDLGLHRYGITPTLLIALSVSTILTSIALILIFRKLSHLSQSISSSTTTSSKEKSPSRSDPIKKEEEEARRNQTFSSDEPSSSSSFSIQVHQDSELPSEQECIQLLIEKHKYSRGGYCRELNQVDSSFPPSLRAFWSLGAHSTRISIHTCSSSLSFENKENSTKLNSSPRRVNKELTVKHMKQATVIGEQKFNNMNGVLNSRESSSSTSGNRRRSSLMNRSSLGGTTHGGVTGNNTNSRNVMVAYGNECVDHRAEFILHYPLKKYFDQYVTVERLEYPYVDQGSRPYSCHADSLMPYCTELLEKTIVKKSLMTIDQSSSLTCQKTLFCALPFYLFGDTHFKERLLTTAFDEWTYDRVYMCLENVLPIFSVGQCSGLSVDCGELFSVSLPVYEGIAVRQALEAMPIAGHTIDSILRNMLVRNQCTNDSSLKFMSSTENEILKDIKEKMCYVKNPKSRATLSSQTLTYELPDKNILRIPDEAANILSDCTEFLFNANSDETYLDKWSQNNSIQECVVKSLEKLSRVEKEAKDTMIKNIVLTGGSCMLNGFVDRFAFELENAMNHSDTLRKTYTNNKGETSDQQVNIMKRSRNDSVIMGADIFMSLSTFDDLCVNRDEYEENGERFIVTTKFSM